MTDQYSFRFLHAGDFQLGMVPFGIDTVPDDVEDRLLNATWQSVARVFQAAISNNVDFVLLTGELVAGHSIPGPRAASFLVNQFEKLHAADIPVYCSRSEVTWPAWCTLPPNVVMLPDTDEFVVHTAQNRMLAQIVSDGKLARRDVFTIQVLPNSSSAVAAQTNYAAATGVDQCGKMSRDGHTIWSAGSPQGRTPNSGGDRGCLVVDVLQGENCNARMVKTADVSWQREYIECVSDVTRAGVVSAAIQRLERIAADSRNSGELVLVDWMLTCTVPGLNYEQMLTDIRTAADRMDLRNVWSVGLEYQRELYPVAQAVTQSSVLADFLKLTESGSARGGDFDADLKRASWLPEELVCRAAEAELETARKVALLGTELL